MAPEASVDGAEAEDESEAAPGGATEQEQEQYSDSFEGEFLHPHHACTKYIKMGMRGRGEGGWGEWLKATSNSFKISQKLYFYVFYFHIFILSYCVLIIISCKLQKFY